MKVLHKKLLYNSKLRERARNERMINGQLGAHPFVVKMRFAFVTDKCLCLVLELAPCGELFQLITNHESGSFTGKTFGRKFPEQAARFYCAESLLALEFLHENDVLYRDLKPENVLIDADGHVTISDFGLSKPGVHDPLKGARSMCGTPEYLAPEILRGTHEHGLAADWWAMGALLYELLSGQPPWYTKDRNKLFERIKTAPLKMPKGLKPKLSKDGEALLRALLHKDNAVRLGTADGAKGLKEHKFFAMVDFDALLLKQIEPPFAPKTLVSKTDVRPDENVDWDDIKPDPNVTCHKMDIPDHRFNEIFAKFEYRSKT